jgi:hypothetical protein
MSIQRTSILTERLRLWAILALTSPTAFIGCATSSTPVVAPTPFQGPMIRDDVSGTFHVLVMESPGAGFAVTLDRVEEERGFEEAFVTIRAPDPRFSFAQVPVQQRLLTSVRSSRPLRVNARMLGFDEIDGAYHPALAPASAVVESPTGAASSGTP